MKGTFGLEYCPKTGMGPVPVRMHAPQHNHHVEKRVSKVLQRITIRDGVSSWTPLCVNPFRIPWFRNPKGWRTSLLWVVCSSAQHTPLQTTRWVHEGAVPRTQQVHDQGWPTKWNWASQALYKKPEMLPQPFCIINLISAARPLGQSQPSD